jgi:hypothetical protein
MSQDASPGIAKGLMTLARTHNPPRTGVLGHSQPSLRDCSWLLPNPGLASWATLSRPFGTQFVNRVLTQVFKALHILKQLWPNLNPRCVHRSEDLTSSLDRHFDIRIRMSSAQKSRLKL